MVGLSYGLPVIAPDLGCLPELLGSGAGLLYRHDDPAGLSRALAAAKVADLPLMSRVAQARADELAWADIAGQTAAVYRG